MKEQVLLTSYNQKSIEMTKQLSSFQSLEIGKRFSLLNKGTEESCPIFILHCPFSYEVKELENLNWIREGRLSGKGGET